MASSLDDRTAARRRQHARLERLKKRVKVASLLGFAAFFGLAAQHAGKGASARRTPQPAGAAARAPSTFFDEHASSFSFDDGDTGALQGLGPQSEGSPPPVAQTSVS